MAHEGLRQFDARRDFAVCDDDRRGRRNLRASAGGARENQ